MKYEAYVSLLASVDDLIRVLQEHPEEGTREQVAALLGGIDAVHREGLERLVERFREFGGDALVERLADDPVVRTLLGLYDLAELDLPEEEGEGSGTARSGAPVGFVPIEEVRFGPPGSGRPDRRDGQDEAPETGGGSEAAC